MIFLVFGVYLVKAEVQEDQAHKVIARDFHPDLQDGTPWMRKEMTMWEKWCLKQKRKKKQPGKGPKKPLKKTVREGRKTPKPLKELARVMARERTREPVKHQLKDGEFRRSGKQRSGKERRRKRR